MYSNSNDSLFIYSLLLSPDVVCSRPHTQDSGHKIGSAWHRHSRWSCSRVWHLTNNIETDVRGQILHRPIRGGDENRLESHVLPATKVSHKKVQGCVKCLLRRQKESDARSWKQD